MIQLRIILQQKITIIVVINFIFLAVNVFVIRNIRYPKKQTIGD